jgi:phosphate-selective porin OprO and OprP
VYVWTRLTVVSFFSVSLWAQEPLQIHGYIQGRFTNQEGTSDRLEIRRARVILFGNPFSQLSYVLQADVLKKPFLLDMALTWKFSRAFSVTGGQFKMPFSAESLIADDLDIPIARARAVEALTAGRDTGVQGRDLGLQIAGALYQRKGPLLEYALGLFRGQTLVQAPAAHYPAIAGRAMLRPWSGFMLGGDWYASFSAPARGEKRREEAEGSYDHGPIHLGAEQIWARDGTLERRGGYALGSWRLSARWEPLTRADWLTTDIHKANTTSIVYLAGLNFYWDKHVKIGVNGGARHDQGPKGVSSVFLAQTMLGF